MKCAMIMKDQRDIVEVQQKHTKAISELQKQQSAWLNRWYGIAAVVSLAWVVAVAVIGFILSQ